MHDTDTLREPEPAGRCDALGFAALLAGAALLLAACGGGSGAAAPAPQPDPDPAPAANPEPEPAAKAEPEPEPAAKAEPEPEPAPAPAPEPQPAFASAPDVWTAAPAMAMTSAARAARQADAFGGATQSSEGRRASASVSPAVEGAVRISVPASGLSFDSAGGAVFEVENELATTARVVVNRDDADADRWSTFGWWMAARGRDFIASAPTSPTVTGVEIGAFADGPEFRTPPASLPVIGKAVYSGSAHGFYASEIGTDGNDPRWSTGGGLCCRYSHIGFGSPGSTFVGEFTGRAQFTIRYDSLGRSYTNPVIGGLVDRVRVSGVATDGATGRKTELAIGQSLYNDTAILSLGRNGFTRDFSIDRRTGQFHSEIIDIYGLTHIRSSGTYSEHRSALVEERGEWAGQVSSMLRADGHPRSIAGTFGVEGRTAGNTRHVFIGAFVLPLTGCCEH